MPVSFVIRTSLMCDEVRTEDNGKNLYIGVYGMGIATAVKPTIFQVVHVLGAEFGGKPTALEMRTKGGGIVTERKVEVPGGQDFFNIITPMTVVALEPRDLNVEVRVSGEEWIGVGTWIFEFVNGAVEPPPEMKAQIENFAKLSKDASDKRLRDLAAGSTKRRPKNELTKLARQKT